MEKSLSFFRVFDLAFFAPGMVIALALWRAGYLSQILANAQIGIPEGVISLLGFLALVYILGLLCHAIQRRFSCFFKPKNAIDSWFKNLQAGPCGELATYFWYLRATCWNLAISVFFAGVIFCWKEYQSTGFSYTILKIVVGVFLACLLLWYLGRDFHFAMERATEKRESEGQTS